MRLPLLRRSICAACLFSAAALRSQTATPAKPAVETDEIVELSPFTVEPDNSWTATTTLSGNRTKQEIAKLPASIEAITSEFIRDLNLGTLEDAAAFVPGLTVQPRLESRNDDGRISYRGLTGASNTSRNFFLWYVPSDTYNVERIDFSRGSNSLMFGDAAPGGQATVYTKRPQFRTAGTAFVSASSFGTSRAQIDLNTAYKKILAVRFNAVNRVDSSYIHHTYQRQKATDLAVMYRPFKGTTILVEGEAGKQVRRRGENAVAILDTAAAGRAFNQNNRWYFTSDGQIFQRPSTAIPTVDTTAASGNSVSLLSGQTAVVTLPGGVKKTYTGYSRYLDVLGPLDYLDRPYNVFQVTIDQSLGKLELEVAYNQQFQHQQRNDNSFGTTQSPPVINVDGNGRPFMDMTGTAQYKDFGNIVKAGRISAAYPFSFGKWMKQFVVLSALRQKDFAHNRRYFLANAAGTGTLQNNIITLRAYFDDPRLDTNVYWAQFELKNMPRTATFQPELFETYANTAPFIDVRYNRNVSASASGEYLGGRLTSLLGVTFSRVSRKIPALSNYTLDARGLIRDPGLPGENPGAFVYDAGYDLGARSTLAGLNYQLLRREALTLHLYGVYSQSFNWQSGTTFYGQTLGPILGNTHEIGLKGDVLDRSLFFSLGVYNIKRQNVAFVWNPDSLSAVQLEDLINPNNLRPGDAGYLPVTTSIVGSERRTVNSQEESSGWDLTLQTKRLGGLQARLTAAVTHVKSAPDFSAFRSFLDAAIQRTTAANAPGGDRTMAESATNIANAETIYSSATLTTKVSGLRSAPYGGSFVLDYEVPQVKALRLGLNGVLTPDYNVGIFNGVAYRSGGRFPLGAYATYDRKLWGRRCGFRVGVQNFYDLINGSSAYRKTGTSGFNNAAGVPNYVYRYVDPVTYTASLDVRF
jgi:outer membrane receptor protein involved in Fe transport